MNITVQRLSAARKVLVRIIQAREDGAKFVPLVLELERRISVAANVDDVLARVLIEAD